MAWDFILGKNTDRDFTCGGLGPEKKPKWTPAMVVKFIEQADAEIKKNAKLIFQGGPSYLRPAFQAFFNKWHGYKAKVDRSHLHKMRTVREVKLWRKENDKFTRALTPTATLGAETILVPVKSNWPLAIGLGIGAGVFGWLAFGKKSRKN